jgi:hypothetical protein
MCNKVAFAIGCLFTHANHFGSKSVDAVWVSIINFVVYTVDSFKIIGTSLEILNLKGSFLKLNQPSEGGDSAASYRWAG